MTATHTPEELERRVIAALAGVRHPLLPSEVGRKAGHLTYHQALAGLEAAVAVGLVDAVEDEDGTVRYLPAGADV